MFTVDGDAAVSQPLVQVALPQSEVSTPLPASPSAADVPPSSRLPAATTLPSSPPPTAIAPPGSVQPELEELSQPEECTLPAEEFSELEEPALPMEELSGPEEPALPAEELNELEEPALPAEEFSELEEPALPMEELSDSEEPALPAEEVCNTAATEPVARPRNCFTAAAGPMATRRSCSAATTGPVAGRQSRDTVAATAAEVSHLNSFCYSYRPLLDAWSDLGLWAGKVSMTNWNMEQAPEMLQRWNFLDGLAMREELHEVAGEHLWFERWPMIQIQISSRRRMGGWMDGYKYSSKLWDIPSSVLSWETDTYQ